MKYLATLLTLLISTSIFAQEPETTTPAPEAEITYSKGALLADEMGVLRLEDIPTIVEKITETRARKKKEDNAQGVLNIVAGIASVASGDVGGVTSSVLSSIDDGWQGRRAFKSTIWIPLSEDELTIKPSKLTKRYLKKIYKTALKAYEDNGIKYIKDRPWLGKGGTYYDSEHAFIDSKEKKCGWSWSKSRDFYCGFRLLVEDSAIENGYLVLEIEDKGMQINDLGLLGIEAVNGIILDTSIYYLYKAKNTYFINEIRNALGKGTIKDSAIQ